MQQLDEILDAIHHAKMVTHVVSEVSLDMERAEYDAPWQVAAMKVELLIHFVAEQVKSIDALEGLFREATTLAS